MLLFLVLTPAAHASASSVEELLAECPSSADVAAFNSALNISFEADPTAGTLVCHASGGSADLTRFQERIYQAFRVMKASRFSRPLPWTTQNLYDWLVATIDGIRFRDDVDFNFCCDPANTIDLRAIPNSEALFTNRWLDASDPIGLAGLVALIAHEARHNVSGPHTCGTNDETVNELGAWGVQYYLELWEALYSGSFLVPPDLYPSYYHDQHLRRADFLLSSFCSLPAADLSLRIENLSRTTAVRGLDLSYDFVVANAGPDTADDVFLYSPVPEGTSLLGAAMSGGSCSADDGGPIACSLGSISPNTSLTVHVSLLVDSGGTVTLITNKQGPLAPGARVIGPYQDSNADNNTAFFALPVATPLENQPPDCSNARATPARLWPPNHKFRLVSVGGVSDPDDDPVSVTITRATQDEPQRARSAELAPEGNAVYLRAERSGGGDGRVYRIAFTASDNKGGDCSGTAVVSVPHDRGGRADAVDSSPPSYDSQSP